MTRRTPIHPHVCARQPFRLALLILSLAAIGADDCPVQAATGAPRVAVAWIRGSDNVGVVQGLEGESPWAPVTSALAVGADPVMRAFEDSLYVLSRESGEVTVIEVPGWTIVHQHSPGPASPSVDIAVVAADRAYVTRESATQLLRLDPQTGATADVVDLAAFADTDGNPDMGTMAQSDNRLFVQLRRIDHNGPPAAPLIAIVDLATETLVDADPLEPGTQAIALQGTYPKGKMQVQPDTRRLILSATGAYFDAGGIELVNLDTFESLGFAVDESDPNTAADTGAFVMTTATFGYVSFSTDLVPSSHLHTFRLPPDGDFGPELQTTLPYIVPRILHDPVTNLIYWPEGGNAGPGVLVFDAGTGAKLTPQPVAVGGTITDLELLCTDGACTSTPVEVKTWGSLKGLFEKQPR